MANFRIKVEALNPDVKVPEELLNGLECDGYFMTGITEDEDGANCYDTNINEVSVIDIAIGITTETNLLEAAMIAHGMAEARQMKRNR